MKKYFTVERLVEENPLSLQTEDRIIASEIQMDYNTIIMSPEFRRMQDKTQVFPLSRGDFVRTRLTHSYEVSIIAEQIARYSILYLDTKQPEGYDWDDEDKERFVDLAKTSGLLHDIGNPPFGHFGETCIRNWFEDNQKRVLCLDKEGNKVYFKELLSTSKTGYPLYEDLLLYDGNVQGLRIILKADAVQEGQNMNFVQSLIHSMVKYPYDSKTAKTLDSKKCGYNHAEKRAFEKVMDTTQSKNPRHVVTYILEAADDIAYRCADIEDAFQKGVITFYDIKRYLSEYLDKNLKYDLRVYNLFNHYYEKAMDDQHHAVEYMRLWLAEVRIFLMKHVAHQFANDFTAIESGKVHKYELTEECYGKNFFHFAQNLTKDLIYTSNIVLDLEVASKACMYDLLELFVDAVIAHDNHIEITTANGDVGTSEPTYYQQKLIKLIPAEYTQRYKNERSDTDEVYNLYLRVLCVLDYISSMTDRFAYEKRNTLMGLNI